MSTEPALFRRYPELRRRVPWLELASVPTPVEPLDLEGAEGRVWIKRDDLSATVYGGNKVRKLEWLLGDARRRGSARLITAGAAGSHHALATTVHGREHGFRVTLVLFPQPVTPHVREVLRLDHALGADIRAVRRMELVPAGLWRARWAHRAETTAVIPPGGSSPAGTLGYVSAALELAEQVAAGEMPAPDVVHVPAGTLGTAAGLAIGLELAGLDTRIRATRVVGRLVTNRRVLRGLIRRTLRVLADAGVAAPSTDDAVRRVTLRHDQYGRGYGAPTAAGARATERFADAGITLDPTYTAKAAAGMFADLSTSPGVHLFWHTLSARKPEVGVVADELPEPVRRLIG